MMKILIAEDDRELRQLFTHVAILTIEKGHISAENIPEGGCRFTVILKIQ